MSGQVAFDITLQGKGQRRVSMDTINLIKICALSPDTRLLLYTRAVPHHDLCYVITMLQPEACYILF